MESGLRWEAAGEVQRRNAEKLGGQRPQSLWLQGYRGVGFGGFRGLGFRGLGFRVLGVLGFRV